MQHMVPSVASNGLTFGYLAAGPEDGLLPLLAERGFRAVAPFMRGYHPTTAPADGDYRVTTLGKDVLALVEAFGRSTAVLIAHAWGAYAVYAAANLRPERVAKLVTVAIPHPFVMRPGALTLGRAYRARHFL